MRGMNPPYLHACVSHIFCGIVGSNLASTSEKVVLGSTYEKKEGGGTPQNKVTMIPIGCSIVPN